MRAALAVTVHDPAGNIRPGVERTAGELRRVFSALAVNATDVTDHRLLASLEAVGADVMTHAVGTGITGRSRREAVALALRSGPDRILYSDLDHVVRWIEAAPDELSAIVGNRDVEAFVVVGRSPEAFERSPARLRETERIVNQIYELATGRSADLMFAVRLLSAAAAERIVAECVEDSIANDVEWPMFAERAGLSVGYVAAEGLDYRTTAEFDQAEDSLDDDVEAWIHRVELAAQHVRVIRRQLEQ